MAFCTASVVVRCAVLERRVAANSASDRAVGILCYAEKKGRNAHVEKKG